MAGTSRDELRKEGTIKVGNARDKDGGTIRNFIEEVGVVSRRVENLADATLSGFRLLDGSTQMELLRRLYFLEHWARTMRAQFGKPAESKDGNCSVRRD